MYILYIDESGSIPKTDPGPGNFFVIAGVIVAEGVWRAIANDLAGVKDEFKVRGELKWKFFGTSNKDPRNNIGHLSLEQRDHLRTKVFKILSDRKAITLLASVTSVHASYA